MTSTVYPHPYVCPKCSGRKSPTSMQCASCRLTIPSIAQPNDSAVRFIPLSRGMVATVDAGDFEWLNQWKWTATHRKHPYAVRYSASINGARGKIHMHRLILGLSDDDERLADHINGNTLDNRRSNLRTASNLQNAWNRVTTKRSRYGLQGVRLRRKQWICTIYHEGKEVSEGPFNSPEEAHAAWMRMERRLRGDFSLIESRGMER